MEIQILRNESDILREYPYGSRPVDGNALVSNKKGGNGSNEGAVTPDTVRAHKPALLSKGSVRPAERKAIVPIKLLLTKEDNDVIFWEKRINAKDTFNNDRTLLFFNISTEVVKDQYGIGKIVLDIPHQKIDKYKEAQAYRLTQKPTLEVFI
jgi:hypothetical protein